MSADTRVIDAAAGAARADLRPYVVRMYDRWIILAIILLVAWSPWVRGLFAFTLYYRGLSFERMLVLTTAVSMLLSRQSRPQRRTVERFARARGVAPEDLWPGFKGDVATEGSSRD